MRKFQWLVLTALLAAATQLFAEPGYVVRSSDLMDEPYRDANLLATLEEEAPVEILKRKGGWLNITAAGKTGWVRMSSVRKGKAPAKPDSGTEAKGILDLASGRAGTGNVVSATGVRGLNEEELKEAKFNPAEIEKMESFTINPKNAKRFAREGKLKARQVKFLPDTMESR
ncbi:MAG: SH3 domain-containing protein [Gammaproteobacteria bacterium]|nr:MAG: SH3 domain-containing protein [Gammaproteobacteria bacterium]